MPSKVIDRFQSQSQLVSAGADAMAEEVGVSLAAKLAPYLKEGEEPVDWVLGQRLIGRFLNDGSQTLEEVDQHLEVGRAANKSLRGERNRISASLRRELRVARMFFDESFDQTYTSKLFARREISRLRSSAVARLARETAAVLRSPEITRDRSLITGALPDPEALAGALEARAEELERSLDDLAPKEKLEILNVGLKNQHLEDAADARRRAQDLLEGIYRAAGFDHLANRLRPKRRRAGSADEVLGQEGGSPREQTIAPEVSN